MALGWNRQGTDAPLRARPPWPVTAVGGVTESGCWSTTGFTRQPTALDRFARWRTSVESVASGTGWRKAGGGTSPKAVLRTPRSGGCNCVNPELCDVVTERRLSAQADRSRAERPPRQRAPANVDAGRAPTRPTSGPPVGSCLSATTKRNAPSEAATDERGDAP